MSDVGLRHRACIVLGHGTRRLKLHERLVEHSLLRIGKAELPLCLHEIRREVDWGATKRIRMRFKQGQLLNPMP